MRAIKNNKRRAIKWGIFALLFAAYIGYGAHRCSEESDVIVLDFEEFNPPIYDFPFSKDSVTKALIAIDKDNCMGKTLLMGLKDRNIRIASKPGVSSSYDRITSGSKLELETIYLGTESPDVAFLEELIHAYQNSQTYSANNHKLNDEIEAKWGWVMYVMREGEPLDLYRKYLGGAHVVAAFRQLNELHTSGVSLYKSENLPQYQYFYNKIAGFFRILGSPYGSEAKYPFSKDHMYFKSIGELMVNC